MKKMWWCSRIYKEWIFSFFFFWFPIKAQLNLLLKVIDCNCKLSIPWNPFLKSLNTFIISSINVPTFHVISAPEFQKEENSIKVKEKVFPAHRRWQYWWWFFMCKQKTLFPYRINTANVTIVLCKILCDVFLYFFCE